MTNRNWVMANKQSNRKAVEIAIMSGKGGTGKTSLSAAFSTIEPNRVVVDCDVDAANLHLILQPETYVEEPFLSGHTAEIDYSLCTHCRLCASYCRFDAISLKEDRIWIDEVACDGCKLCARICPEQAITMVPSQNSRWYIGNYRNGKLIYARLAPGEENSGRLVSLVREEARKVAAETHSEVIIIDGPPGTGCPAIASITGAKMVVAVTEPSQSGLHDLKRLVELTANFHIPSFVVINKHDLNPAMSRKIVTWCLEKGIEMIGKIPFNDNIVEAMVHCKSVVEWDPESEPAKMAKTIWETVMDRAETVATKE